MEVALIFLNFVLAFCFVYLMFVVTRLEIYIRKTEEDPQFDLTYREFVRKFRYFGGLKDDRKKK